jgi:hypothetical protein
MGGCIEVRHVGSCAYEVDFTRSPSAARWVYARSRTLIIPSVLMHTMKRNPVVLSCVRLGPHGREQPAPVGASLTA